MFEVPALGARTWSKERTKRRSIMATSQFKTPEVQHLRTKAEDFERGMLHYTNWNSADDFISASVQEAGGRYLF